METIVNHPTSILIPQVQIGLAKDNLARITNVECGGAYEIE